MLSSCLRCAQAQTTADVTIGLLMLRTCLPQRDLTVAMLLAPWGQLTVSPLGVQARHVHVHQRASHFSHGMAPFQCVPSC
jgi:hypothetical protein